MSLIVITEIPLADATNEQVFAISKYMKDLFILESAIKEVAEILKKEGIEVFEQRDNVIVTEQGYKIACWEDDLQLAEDSDN